LMKKGAREEDIIQAEENLKQAEINLSLAKNDKERMENLYKSKSITTKQYEDALARFDLASAQFNAAKENLHKVKNNYRYEEHKQNEKERMENHYKSKSITTKKYEDALARFDLESAQFKAAKENLHKVKNIYREEEIKQAEADLKKSIAAVELLMKNIKDSYVV